MSSVNGDELRNPHLGQTLARMIEFEPRPREEIVSNDKPACEDCDGHRSYQPHKLHVA
ncbi:MAG: hypothetical protein ACYC0X_00005 [Pirellulaceae bacterium]